MCYLMEDLTQTAVTEPPHKKSSRRNTADTVSSLLAEKIWTGTDFQSH